MQKRCPWCGAEYNNNLICSDIRKHVRKCKTCGKLSRKKFSIVLVLMLFLFAFVGANFKTHFIFSIAAILLAIFIVYYYVRLPYVPFE